MVGRTCRVYVVLIASLAVLYLGPAPACGDVSEAPLLRQMIVEDFDGPASDGGKWQTYPGGGHSGVRYRLDASQRRGSGGHALHLQFDFADADTEAVEVGFRVRLHGLDASDYDHLRLWVKGDAVEGYARSFRVEFRRPEPEDPPGLGERGSYVITGITGEWQRFQVPLNLMTGITEWSNLTAFGIGFHPRRSPARHGGYYVDDIALVRTGTRGPSVRDEVVAVRKRAWTRALGGEGAAKAQLRARLTGWPSHLVEDRQSLPQDDREFLWRVVRDTWRGLEALSDRAHGLPLDNVRFMRGSVTLADTSIGDYTNITSIGLYLVSIVAARELGLVTAEEAVGKLGTTLDTLERLERYHGFFYNYYDTTTLERTSNFVSFVDSTWLTAGLMVVRMTFPMLYDRCTALIEEGNYALFYTDVEQQMSQGYYVNLHSPSEYTYGALYTESRLGSLIAIGKGDVPEEHWFRMMRTFPVDDDWQVQKPENRKAKTVRSHELRGGYYRWKGLTYVPSWGGSMFEALMPNLLVDEQAYAPGSLGANDVAHAVIQRRYALEELGYPVWGMSPSSTPETGRYAEYGVTVLGARGYRAGVVSPHAAALALPVTPRPALANLRKLSELYDIYGEYGFYDAVDPISGKVAYSYLALDQAMLFIAVANYLRDQCVQRHFAADPIARRALSLIGDERFFD